MQKIKPFILFLGPAIFFALQAIGPSETIPTEAFSILSATIWIALWWVFEVVPISVTALLPIVLFPLSGGLDLSTTTASYGHKYVFLYMGGFMIAIAIEKWNLHKRIALNIISFVGTNIHRIILGCNRISFDVDFEHSHFRNDASNWHFYCKTITRQPIDQGKRNRGIW